MLRHFKSITMILLVFVLVASTLIGCSGGNNEAGDNNTTTNNKGNTDVPEDTGLPMTNGKYDPAVTITTVAGVGPNIKFKEGETIEDNVHTRWAKDRLGIDIEYLWTTSTVNEAFDTKLMLSLSANEKLPDIINVPVSGTIAQELIDSGKFREVGSLFDEYANAEWKSAMAEVSHEWSPYTRNGEKFGIPSLDYQNMNDKVLWIRQDWLDKLKLSAPTTLQELETVMEAFKTQDPDGNNQNDTVPLALALKSIPNAWIDSGFIYGMFGTLPETWMKDDAGNLVYGSIQPGAKQALGKMAEWLEKGYIHKEAGLHDEMKASQLFTAGNAGIVVGPTWVHSWPLKEVEVNIPGAKVEPYGLPTGPDGKAGRLGALAHNRVTLINKDMEHPEIFFTYTNYLYAHYANPQPGSEFEYGGAENYDWMMKDGKVVMEENVIKETLGESYKVENYFLTQPAARIPSLQIKTFAKLSSGGKPETPYEERMVTKVTPQSGNY
jgi:putative aldouronate transport system substrate-binding protein